MLKDDNTCICDIKKIRFYIIHFMIKSIKDTKLKYNQVFKLNC